MGKIVKINRRAAETPKPVLKKIEPLAELPGIYLSMIKSNPLNQKAYMRLMIIYRKEKKYEKELAIIDKAIKAFEAVYQSKKSSNKKIQSISRSLNRQLGLTDSKGKAVYSGEPIAGWKKRRETVVKRQFALKTK